MSDLSFEISQEEFSALPENDRLLIDIRDQASISYGMIPGALHVPQENVPEWADTPKAFSKCIVLYCSRGIFRACCKASGARAERAKPAGRLQRLASLFHEKRKGA